MLFRSPMIMIVEMSVRLGMVFRSVAAMTRQVAPGGPARSLRTKKGRAFGPWGASASFAKTLAGGDPDGVIEREASGPNFRFLKRDSTPRKGGNAPLPGDMNNTIGDPRSQAPSRPADS